MALTNELTVEDAPRDTPVRLSTRAARGAAWTLPTSLVSRAIGLIGTLVLARYLTPADYGILTAASIVTLTASTVTTLGVGVFLVATPDISRQVTFHVTCWFLATGAASLALVMILAGPIGRWVSAPMLVEYMPMLVLISAMERVIYIPERLLVRRLRLARLSIARATSELAFTGTSVALAAGGLGAMALIWAGLVRSSIRFLSIVPAVDRRDWLEPHHLCARTFRKIIAFGMNVSAALVATFAMRRWDNLLISRYFGADTMGAYNYAYNLGDTPAVAVGEQLSDVMAASFPQLAQQQRPAAVIRSCRLMSLIMFPLAAGLGVVAPTLARVFFNEKWAHVGSMLVWLSVLSIARPIGDIVESYFYAGSRPMLVTFIEWATLIGILIGIPLVSRGGVEWACIAVGFVFVLRALAALWGIHRADHVSIAALLNPIWRPLAACAAMVTGVLFVREMVNLAPTAQLFVEVTTGAILYAALMLVVARAAIDDLVGLIRSALAR